jgi:hypothetical protein
MANKSWTAYRTRDVNVGRIGGSSTFASSSQPPENYRTTSRWSLAAAYDRTHILVTLAPADWPQLATNRVACHAFRQCPASARGVGSDCDDNLARPRSTLKRWFVLLGIAAAGAACSSSAMSVASDAGDDAGTEDLALDEGTFTVEAGDEVVYCVHIPMPAAFQGRDLAMTGWSSTIPGPMHHYFMFYDPAPTSGTTPVPCENGDAEVPAATAGLNLFNMGRLLFVAGVGQDSYTDNDGYGAVLTSNGSFVTNHHVINATANAVTVGGKFDLKVTSASAIPHPTQALSCQTVDISLPPGAQSSVTATCLAPFDLDVTSLSSHAHQDLMAFDTQVYDGTATQPAIIYTSTQWESPTVEQLTTPLHLSTGQGLTFTCHYDNMTSASIGFGLTATQEMCAVMASYAYPLSQTGKVPPMLGATISSNATPVQASNTASGIIPLF